MTDDEIVLLVAIIKSLAEGGDPLDSETGDCVLCGYWPRYEPVPGGHPWQRRLVLSSHDVNCPYRMAKELMGGVER